MIPRDTIETPRLRLVASAHVTAFETLDYFQRNRAHFAPWDPPIPQDFLSLVGQARRVEQSIADFRLGAGFRYWIVLREHERRIIGQCNFSQVARGPFQSAMLGYSVDRAHEGQGIMREALDAALDEVFSERCMLHRVQANVRPENRRSIALLERLRFEREGLARNYLFIDGAWRDHVNFAKLNPNEQPPP
ncbi:MAG: GNAT family N-acetyltransferase [Polyangiales bacterium]